MRTLLVIVLASMVLGLCTACESGAGGAVYQPPNANSQRIP